MMYLFVGLWNWGLVHGSSSTSENDWIIESPPRACAATWNDPDGNLWLFGGIDGNLSSPIFCNDLWKFDPVS